MSPLLPLTVTSSASTARRTRKQRSNDASFCQLLYHNPSHITSYHLILSHLISSHLISSRCV
eukprot:338003-Hanusia_phi.AAC.1